MATKCIVIETKNKRENKKPIEVCFVLNGFCKVTEEADPSIDFNYIELLCLDYGNGYDLMFAYDDPNERGHGTLYIGHWNDGFVENNE